MSRVKKSMKQKMAAFLAVCMTAGSLPTGMVTAAETRERPEDANLAEIIEFDPVKLKDAMEKAVESDKMVTPPTVVASSSEISGFYGAVYELKDAETLLAADAAMPAQTDVRIFLSPQSEGFGEDGKYELTGTEGMVFMIENQGNEDQGYQLLFGNKITDVIEVESKERLLEAYYNPEDLDTATEAEAETVPETNAPAADNAAESGTGETAGETEGSWEVPGTETPETDPVATESETQTVAEVSILDRLLGTLVAYGAEPTATDSEDEAFDKTDDGDQPTEPENGSNLPAGETPAESQESTEGETAVTDPATTETVEETEAAEEDKTPEAEKEEEGPRFTAVDDRGYVRLTSGQVSASVLVVKSSFDKIDVEEGMSEPMGVEVTTTRRMAKMANAANGISLMNADDETEAVDDNKLAAVAFYETNAADLLARAGGDGESPFTVNLYDYAGEENNNASKDINTTTKWKALNDYLADALENNTGAFGFGAQPDDSPLSRYRTEQGIEQNIYQGIPDIIGKDRLLRVLFPETQPSELKDIIKVYPDVIVEAGNEDNEFFALSEDGEYSFDSNFNTARYQENNKTLVREGGTGFWPFGGTNAAETDDRNNFFGMSLKFDFYKPENGRYGQNDDPMVFSFSGDDDVWVYITNKTTNQSYLVLDMGGNHGRMDGTINFATGEIVYSNKNAASHEYDNKVIFNPTMNGEFKRTNEGASHQYSTFTTQIPGWETDFMKAGEDGEYTLEFYYLERGGISNCQIQFKLPVIPKKGITVSKRLTGKLNEAIKNDYYNFNLVSSSDFEVLNKVRTGKETLQENEGNVTSTPFNLIQGAGQSSLSEVLERGEFFYIEEVDPSGTSNVSWTVASSGSGNISPVKETAAGQVETVYYSAIYQVPDTDEDTGFLFMCTNEFGSLNPTVKKQAWKDNSMDSEGIYDIVLEVTGDEIQTETGTGSSDALNVVFVMDKSTSISKSDFEGMKESVVDIAKNLEAGSQVSVIAFSGDGSRGNHYSYDDPASSKYYTNVTNDWLQFNGTGESDESVSKLRRALAGIEQSGYTHTAAGFLGAKNMLNELGDNSNPKVVIFMTDGRPNTYIHTNISKDYNYVGRGNGSYSIERGRYIYVGPGNGSFELVEEIRGYSFLGEDGNNEVYEAAEAKAVEKLKEVAEMASVYAISYKYSAITGSADDSWMKVESGNGVKGYYKAENIEQLKNALVGAIESEQSSSKVQDLKVTDVLSKYVDAYGETDDGVTGPEMYLKNGKVSHNDNGATKDGIPLIASKNPSGQLEYRMENNDAVIATYDPDTKTITWNVANSLGENETKTLTVRVKVSEQAEYYANGVYPNNPVKLSTSDTTGTHDDEKGYYSNDSAILTYTGGEKEFDKPVVQPVQSYTTLTLKKEVKGQTPDNWSFVFNVGFTKPLKDEGDPELDSDGYYVYEYTLTDSTREVIIDGVPVGASYKVWEDAEMDDPYTVTNVRYTVTPAGAGSEVDDVVTGTVGKSAITVTCTNTIGKYSFIEISKTVEDDANLVDPNTKFTFTVYKDTLNNEYKLAIADNGIYTYDPNGDSAITLEANETAIVRVEPSDTNSKFIVVETEDGDAWKTTYTVDGGNPVEQVTDEDSKSVATVEGSTDHEIAFTNYYYEHLIQLTKSVNGDEFIKNAEYPFAITFETANNASLRLDDMEISISAADGNQVTDEDRQWTMSQNVLSGDLKKDETIVISNLPQCVTGYKIEETTLSTEGKPYRVVVDTITKNGDKVETVNVVFDLEDNQTDKIIFTNKYEYLYGYLQIQKKIEDGNETNAVFTFKVSSTDTSGQVFYVTVKGNSTSEAIQVPIGQYKVEEVDSTVRYDLVKISDSLVSVTSNNTEVNPATVTVTNKNTGHNYFSDVDTIVNNVEDDKFVPDPTPKSLDGYSSLAASTQTALEMNAGAYLLPNNKIRMQPNNGDEMIQPA